MLHLKGLSKDTLLYIYFHSEVAKKEAGELLEKMSGSEKAGIAPITGSSTSANKPKRRMSPEGRARIAAAQRARWAKEGAKEVTPPPATETKPKRKLSAAGRRAIREGVKKRWAMFHAQAGTKPAKTKVVAKKASPAKKKKVITAP